MAKKPTKTDKNVFTPVDHSAPPPKDFSLSEPTEEAVVEAVKPAAVVTPVATVAAVKVKEDKKSIQYKWEIGHLDVADDTIVAAHWKFSGNDGANEVAMYGVYNLGPADKKDFIPFEKIKEENILGWIMAEKEYPDDVDPTKIVKRKDFDIEAMKAQIARDLEVLYNPPVVTKPAPWK